MQSTGKWIFLEFGLSPASFEVTGSRKDRRIKCPLCGQIVKITILPHLRRMHPKIWDQWGLDFVGLYNKGYSSKQIMRKYHTLFSWVVIEKEIRKVAEEHGIKLFGPKTQRVGDWQPKKFKKETTTLWAFPERGNWCVHSGEYRGNWAPQVPRNIILQYSHKRDLVLDCFLGGGTTIMESWLLGRSGIGVDISPHAINLSLQRLHEMQRSAVSEDEELELVLVPSIIRGDARALPFLSNESIDLICCQPPYANAIAYTWQVDGDISRIQDIAEFCKEMRHVAIELLRVLKTGKRCVLMIGDVRREKMIIPLGFQVMQRFSEVGFDLEEIIIKKQYKDRSNQFYRGKTRRHNPLRYRIDHEYLFIFKKPGNVDLRRKANEQKQSPN